MFRSILLLLVIAIVLGVLLWKFELVAIAFSWLLSICFPIILGVVFAFVLNIPMRNIESGFLKSKKKWVHKIKRPVSLLVSVLIVLAILATFVVLVVPMFFEALKTLYFTLQDLVLEYAAWFGSFGFAESDLMGFFNNLSIDWNDLGNQAFDWVKFSLQNVLGQTFFVLTQVLNGAVNVILAFIIAVYILACKEKLKEQIKAVLKAVFAPKIFDKIRKVLRICNVTFSAFLSGQILEALILGTLCFVGMAIFQFPQAGMISALIGILALVPLVGAYVGCALGAFIILAQNPLQALLFVVFFIILQQIEGNLIYPRVVGSQVGISPLWVIIAIIIGGGLFSIPGIFFAVPVMSVIYQLVRESTYNKLDRLNMR